MDARLQASQSATQVALSEHRMETTQAGERVRTAVDTLATDMRDRFARVEARIDTSIVQINARIDTSFAQVNARIDTGFAQVNARIDTTNAAIDARFAEQTASLVKWMVGLVLGAQAFTLSTVIFLLGHGQAHVVLPPATGTEASAVGPGPRAPARSAPTPASAAAPPLPRLLCPSPRPAKPQTAAQAARGRRAAGPNRRWRRTRAGCAHGRAIAAWA
jgi:hypothetical protein